MIQFPFRDVFTEIGRRHRAMQTLQQFVRDEPAVAAVAEAIRRTLEPVRDYHDRWITDPDGGSRPGQPVNRNSLRENVRRLAGDGFSEPAFQRALALCTVNTRARAAFYPVWEALQDLAPDVYRPTDRARAIRCHYDLLLEFEQGQLRTAVTRCDPRFALHRNPSSGEVRLGRLIDRRGRIDHHYYLLAVYGNDPEYLDLGTGEFLYFDDPEIRD